MIDNEVFRNMRGMIKHDTQHGRRSVTGQEAYPAVDRSPTYKPGVAGSNPAVPTP
jgi:hypothetical protein